MPAAWFHRAVRWTITAGLVSLLGLVPALTGVRAEASDSPPPITAIIVRYESGVAPGSFRAPTGSGRVPEPQRSRLRLGDSLGSRMFVIRLTRPVTPAAAERICRELERDHRIEWAEPDERARPVAGQREQVQRSTTR